MSMVSDASQKRFSPTNAAGPFSRRPFRFRRLQAARPARTLMRSPPFLLPIGPMTRPLPAAVQHPTRVRYGVLGFACALSLIPYLDRVCCGPVATNIHLEFAPPERQQGLLFAAFALAYAAFE